PPRRRRSPGAPFVGPGRLAGSYPGCPAARIVCATLANSKKKPVVSRAGSFLQPTRRTWCRADPQGTRRTIIRGSPKVQALGLAGSGPGGSGGFQNGAVRASVARAEGQC